MTENKSCINGIDPINCVRTDCRYYATKEKKCIYHRVAEANERRNNLREYGTREPPEKPPVQEEPEKEPPIEPPVDEVQEPIETVDYYQVMIDALREHSASRSYSYNVDDMLAGKIGRQHLGGRADLKEFVAAEVNKLRGEKTRRRREEYFQKHGLREEDSLDGGSGFKF